MDTATEPRVGSFSWVELRARNSETAKSFYQGLFNWSYAAESLPEGQGQYISAMVKDLPAAGMFTMPKEMVDQNIPPHWGSYIRVEGLEETVGKAQSLGAEVLLPPMDVMEAGRMATLRDPEGAIFHMWEKKNSAGAPVHNESEGFFSWNELLVKDARKAKEFYAKLFNWQASENEMEGKTYISLKHQDGHPVGGLMEIHKDQQDITPHWGVYFTVKNMDKSLTYIKNHGGKILFGPKAIENMGTFATCQDPEGACFSIFSFIKR